jgi:hypothetical protein
MISFVQMKNTPLFYTLKLSTARLVAILTIAAGVGGGIYCAYKLSQGNYVIGISGTLLCLLPIAMGMIGPPVIELFNDRLEIRRGCWRTPSSFLNKEIRELHFSSDKKGQIFILKTADKEETFRFNQHPLVKKEFARCLELCKIRVSGKR